MPFLRTILHGKGWTDKTLKGAKGKNVQYQVLRYMYDKGYFDEDLASIENDKKLQTVLNPKNIEYFMTYLPVALADYNDAHNLYQMITGEDRYFGEPPQEEQITIPDALQQEELRLRQEIEPLERRQRLSDEHNKRINNSVLGIGNLDFDDKIRLSAEEKEHLEQLKKRLQEIRRELYLQERERRYQTLIGTQQSQNANGIDWSKQFGGNK